jgi:hypothetical protein
MCSGLSVATIIATKLTNKVTAVPIRVRAR